MLLVRTYKLEIIVFITGAAVMVLELIGSRIVAPYIGTSFFVWTSLIGVILGSLSLGYWWGGKIADRGANLKTFSIIIFIAAILVGAVSIISPLILTIINMTIKDLRIASVLASLVLFAAPSVLLGMVSPYAARLKIKDVRSSGSAVGNLYAISTIGSIAGTFIAGFFLIAILGSAKILLITAATLIFTSFLGYREGVSALKIGVFIYFIGIAAALNIIQRYFLGEKVIDIDTQYNRAFVFKSTDFATKRPIRVLTERFSQIESAMFLDDDNDLVSEYLKFFRLAGHFNPGAQKTLLIGGAGFSYPKDFLKRNPDAFMDVVEIDPAFTEIAKKFFGLKENPRLTIYHEDGRTFLNRGGPPSPAGGAGRGSPNFLKKLGGRKYDAILIDAFKSLSIPYQLTTKEATQKLYNILNDNGVVIVNIISAIEGGRGKFFRAEYHTFSSTFPNLHVFPVQDPNNREMVQNLILTAFKNNERPLLESKDPELNGYLSHIWKKDIVYDMPILTDDFAPVDNYVMESN